MVDAPDLKSVGVSNPVRVRLSSRPLFKLFLQHGYRALTKCGQLGVSKAFQASKLGTTRVLGCLSELPRFQKYRLRMWLS